MWKKFSSSSAARKNHSLGAIHARKAPSTPHPSNQVKCSTGQTIKTQTRSLSLYQDPRPRSPMPPGTAQWTWSVAVVALTNRMHRTRARSPTSTRRRRLLPRSLMILVPALSPHHAVAIPSSRPNIRLTNRARSPKSNQSTIRSWTKTKPSSSHSSGWSIAKRGKGYRWTTTIWATLHMDRVSSTTLRHTMRARRSIVSHRNA